MNSNERKMTLLAVAAAKFWKITRSRLESDTTRECAWPRQVCQWLANDAGISKAAIAVFWKLDRSTIYNSCDKVNDLLQVEPYVIVEIKQFTAYAKNFLIYGCNPD